MKYWYINGFKHGRAIQTWVLKFKVRWFLARVIYGASREKKLSVLSSLFLAGFQLFKNNYNVTITFKD